MRRLRLKNRFAGLPSFGILGTVICGLTMPIAILVNPFFAAKNYVGLRVHILRDLAMVKAVSGSEPIVLRIDAEHRYYLNSKQVPAKELPAALQEALRLRLDKVVFVYAHPDVDYGETVFAIDAASGAHARVVLITSLAKD
jgi:biopolymer transport protein ExbD